MNVDIRQLDVGAVADYKAIRLEALKNEPTAFAGDYTEESAQGDEFHAIRLQISIVYGAYVDNKMVGMVGVILFREKKLQHKATLWGVYVSPDYRGQGISRQLMEHVLAALPDAIKKITLSVEINNQSAIALYRSLGFETYGEEKAAFVNDGTAHDEFMMVKMR